MTSIVNQLETYDKSNLVVIRIEFAKLQKKLQECQEEQEFLKPDIGEAVRKLRTHPSICLFCLLCTCAEV